MVMRRSRIAIATLLPLLAGACHAYSSTTFGAVSAGDRVRALLTQEQFDEFEEHLLGGDRRVEGTVVEADGDGMLLEVPIATLERGIRLESYHQRLRVPASGVADLEIQSLDRLRTYTLVGLAAAGVGAIVWDQLLSGSRRRGDGPPGPPEENVAIVLHFRFPDA